MANPFIPFPFARNGNKTQISDTRTDGIVNFNQGYGDDYSRELGVDPAAKAVERDGQNWLFGVITENIIEWQSGAAPLYLAPRQYAINAYVRYATGAADSAKLYRCIAVPPVGTLPTNTNYWEEVLTSAQIRLQIPMPYRGVQSAAVDFNDIITSGTWVFDNASNVNNSSNAPPNPGIGMLEVRIIGESAPAPIVQRYTSQSGSIFIRGRGLDGSWTAWYTNTFPVPVAQGGTGATTAEQARTNLGLGTAATQNMGTSGRNVPFMNGSNEWSGSQVFSSSAGIRAQGFGGAANYARIYGGTGAAMLEYDGTKWAVGNPVTGTYTVLEGGGTTWTSGNFNPNTKVSKTGDTMTGTLTINNAAIRLQGWNGATGEGVVYFGATDNYIYKQGVSYIFKTENFSSVLNAGGTVFTTGNFNPDLKLDVSKGVLRLNNQDWLNAVGYLTANTITDNSGAWRYTAPSDYTDIVSLPMYTGNHGIAIAASFSAVQRFWLRSKHDTRPGAADPYQYWKDWVEVAVTGVSQSVSFGTVNANGNITATGSVISNQNFQSSSPAVVVGASGGGVYLRPNGSGSTVGETRVQADGTLVASGNSVCREAFISANGDVLLGGQGGIVYLRPNGVASASGEFRVGQDGTSFSSNSFSTNGGVSAQGPFTSAGGLSSFCGGYVRLNPGTTTNAGYISFHTADGVRKGYIGWVNANRLEYNVEGGYTGHYFAGSLTVQGGFNWGSSLKLKDIEGPIQYTLEDLDGIDVFVGRYKPGYNPDGRRRLFHSAESLMEVVPETVDEKGASYEGEEVAATVLDQIQVMQTHFLKLLNEERRIHAQEIQKLLRRVEKLEAR